MDPNQNAGRVGTTVPVQPQPSPIQPAPSPINNQYPISNNQLSRGTAAEENQNAPIVKPFYDQYPTAQAGEDVKADPWAGDFLNQPDANAVQAANADIAKFDPTPSDPLSVSDLYGGSSNWQQYDQGRQNLQAGMKAQGLSNALAADEASRLDEIKRQLGGQMAGGANKEREMVSVAPVEQHPVVEVAKVPEVREIHEAGETGVEAVQKEHTILPEAVVHEGETLVTNAEPERVKIEVPITQSTYQSGFKLDLTFALRWLVESIKKLTLKGDKEIAFKAN